MEQYHFIILASNGSSNHWLRSRHARSSLVEQTREPGNRLSSASTQTSPSPPHRLEHGEVGNPHRQPSGVRLVDTLICKGTKPHPLSGTVLLVPDHRKQRFRNSVVLVISDNSTTVAYIQKQAGTVSGIFLYWPKRYWYQPGNTHHHSPCEIHSRVSLTLSRKNQLVPTEWPICRRIFHQLTPITGKKTLNRSVCNDTELCFIGPRRKGVQCRCPAKHIGRYVGLCVPTTCTVIQYFSQNPVRRLHSTLLITQLSFKLRALWWTYQ